MKVNDRKKLRKKPLIYDDDDKANQENSNIFAAKREFSEYRPTDAISNHKCVNPLPKINVRNIFSAEYCKKTSS